MKVTIRPIVKNPVFTTMVFPIFLFLIMRLLSESETLECGLIYDSKGSRIIGGYDGGKLMYPWFATLQYKAANNQPICAGTLITKKHILTAAHCFTADPSRPKKDLFRIALNTYDRCNDSEPTREIHEVVKAVAHEKYDYPKKPYDIAIIEMATETKLPIACMPPKSSQNTTEPGLIMGFGYTKEGVKEQPCHLQQAQVTKFSPKQCMNTSLPAEDTSDPGAFCGGAPGKDTCQGDSGGPFITQGSDLRYTVSGIVSYGYGCGREGYPGIYTNVAAYLDWIAKQLDGVPTETDPKHSDGSSSQTAASPGMSGTAASTGNNQVRDLFGRGNTQSGSARFPGGSDFNSVRSDGNAGVGVSNAADRVTFPGSSDTTYRAQQNSPSSPRRLTNPPENTKTNTWKAGEVSYPASANPGERVEWFSGSGKLENAENKNPQPVTFPKRSV